MTTATTSTKGIAAKLVAVMGDVDAITKRGVNSKQDYKYVKAADVANGVRAALIKHGVAFTYDVESERQWVSETKNGSVMQYCSLTVRGTFLDKDSGESLSGRAVGWGADSLDKAPYKAMTGALKYILRMNALIPDEEDPEKDNEHYEEARPRVETVRGTITEAKASAKAFYLKVGDKLIQALPAQIEKGVEPGVEIEAEVAPEQEANGKKFHPLVKILAVVPKSEVA